LFLQIRQILSNIAIRFNVFATALIYAREVALGGVILTRFEAPVSMPGSRCAYHGKQPVKNKGAIRVFFWKKHANPQNFNRILRLISYHCGTKYANAEAVREIR
jgi:hypothetical protein